MKTQKIISFIAIAMLVLVSDCITSKKNDFLLDSKNPCTPGIYENAVECEHWKKSSPKKYLKYKERIRKDSIYWLIN